MKLKARRDDKKKKRNENELSKISFKIVKNENM